MVWARIPEKDVGAIAPSPRVDQAASRATSTDTLARTRGGGRVRRRACNLFGFLYANGQGVKQDAGEAVRWYRKAAEQGQADAQ